MFVTRCLAAVCCLISVSSVAQAQQSSAALGEFDCVIEPKMMIKLGSAETGIVESVKVDRDSTVKRGDIVAQLDSDLQKYAVDISKLKASSDVTIRSEQRRLTFRSGEAERATTLYSRQVGTTKARDEALTEQELAQLAVAKAELDQKMAEVELAQAATRLERRGIRSPVNGVVADVTVRPGEYVYEQTTLMTIADIDPLYVKVFVPVRDYAKVRVGNVAEVKPELPVGGSYRAKVTVVDRVFDTASSTFGIRLELPNPDYKLPAGLRCRVRF